MGSFEREEATNENAEEPQIASGAVEQTTEGMTAEGAADESEWTEKEDDWRPVTTTTALKLSIDGIKKDGGKEAVAKEEERKEKVVEEEIEELGRDKGRIVEKEKVMKKRERFFPDDRIPSFIDWSTT